MPKLHTLTIFFVILALIVWTNGHSDVLGKNHTHHTPDTRIINGQIVKKHAVKYIVALRMFDQTTGKYSSCGGSLISDRHILTAAHCVRGKSVLEARFGAHDRFSNEPDQTIERGLDSFIYNVHPFYEPGINRFDLAIIRLLYPLNLNYEPYVTKAQLPTARDALQNYDDQTVVTYGWGWINDNPIVHPTQLMRVRLKVIDYETCFNQMQAASYPYPSYLHGDEICTDGHGPYGSIGACHGDSGGPLVHNGIVIGVVSRSATGNCTNREPTVYVSVGHNLDWIDYTMEKLKF